MNKLIFRFSLIIGLLQSLVVGQFDLNVSYNYYTDDNLFRSPEPIQDNLSSYQLATSFGYKNSGLQLYNYFNVLNYQENNSRNFITNNLGFSEQIGLGENKISNLYFGGNWNLRKNKSDYEYYNYSQISSYINIQLFTEIFLIKGGYNYRWRDYTNWEELSNNLQNVYLQINKSFPNRTTLIIETGLGNKSFIGTDTVTTTITTGGQGNGRHSSGGTMEITDEIEKSLSISQLNLTFRLAQSLRENVGLYVQYFKQQHVDEKISYSNFDDYFQDDELFDDPFTYESEEYSSQLTWMLPKLSKIVLYGAYANKNYISEKAYLNESDIESSGALRNDEQIRYNVNLSKTFKMKKDWINTIKFNLYYSYRNNESNSYWYNYTSSTFGGGIQINF